MNSTRTIRQWLFVALAHWWGACVQEGILAAAADVADGFGGWLESMAGLTEAEWDEELYGDAA